MKRAGLMLAALVAAGCAAMKAQYADDAYMAQQIACVDQYDTKAAIDNCRENVRRKWRVGEDAGVDAAPDAAQEGGAK